VLKYAVSLGSDHPWRLNVMANIARAEEDDLASGIPQQLRQLLFLGDVGIDGETKAISLSGANPFRDVANYATLAGFMMGGEGNLGAVTSQLNPFLSTALQKMGVDPVKGQADLYPDLAVDPVSGQLAVTQDTNAPLSLLNNLVPQSRAVTQLAGLSADFRRSARKDPSSAGRMLMASVGIPVVPRTVNIPQEIAKSEVRQYNSMVDTKNEAMLTGDLGLMQKYPGLRAFKVRVEKLQASQAGAKYSPDPTRPGGQSPGVAELAAKAVTQR
jgi:hypothetical protein